MVNIYIWLILYEDDMVSVYEDDMVSVYEDDMVNIWGWYGKYIYIIML